MAYCNLQRHSAPSPLSCRLLGAHPHSVVAFLHSVSAALDGARSCCCAAGSRRAVRRVTTNGLPHALRPRYGPVVLLRSRVNWHLVAWHYAPTHNNTVEALQQLYNSTAGWQWRRDHNWMSSVDPCAAVGWYGVECSATCSVVAMYVQLFDFVGRGRSSLPLSLLVICLYSSLSISPCFSVLSDVRTQPLVHY